ncbi:hypothetical protein HELRODRAFT_167572 [Helobdella robusta]|uniref:LRRNT domain-containing protein n=1 Tax=Helobdella robusta TaxID=6412 RepID=T1EZI1_HELRO|nr:hypothetical protein HELRODRAFT_167572 [Helobdella robusta]ESO11050.1 hypothetical protein HELRODRAFT_167572 [Helobdella robusta]
MDVCELSSQRPIIASGFIELNINCSLFVAKANYLIKQTASSNRFQYNRVKKLTSETFSGSAELITLDLEGNELSTIPNSALRKLSKLRAMSLRNNRIHDISPGAFSGVSSHLNYLDLGENGSPIVIRKHAFCGLDRPLPEQTAQQLHQHVALDGSQMKHSQQPQHPQLHTQQQHASDYPMNRKSAKHHKPHQNLTYIHRLHSQRRRPDLNIDISLVGMIYANEQREGLIELYLDHNGLRHFDMCLLRSLWTLEVLDLVGMFNNFFQVSRF